MLYGLVVPGSRLPPLRMHDHRGIRGVEENSALCAYALSSIRRACHSFSQVTSILFMVCMNVSKGGGGFVEPLPLTLLPHSAAQYVMDTPSL